MFFGGRLETAPEWGGSAMRGSNNKNRIIELYDVISPYYPYSRIDVRGIPRGAKVEDPSTHRIFINP